MAGGWFGPEKGFVWERPVTSRLLAAMTKWVSQRPRPAVSQAPTGDGSEQRLLQGSGFWKEGAGKGLSGKERFWESHESLRF